MRFILINTISRAVIVGIYAKNLPAARDIAAGFYPQKWHSIFAVLDVDAVKGL